MEIIWQNVARIVEVTEEEIAHAMRAYHQDTHNLAEGAAALAGALKENKQGNRQRIGIILSGGNVDQQTYAKVLADNG
jgi:threonine dehydratase